MATRRYGPALTVIVVPQANGRSRSFRLPISALICGLAALVALSSVAAWNLTQLLRDRRNLHEATKELAVLRGQNATQNRDLAGLSQDAAAIAEELQRLRTLDQLAREILSQSLNPRQFLDDPAINTQSEARNVGGQGGVGHLVDRSGGWSWPSRRADGGTAPLRRIPASAGGESLLETYRDMREESGQLATSLAGTLKELPGHLDFLAHRPEGVPISGEITSSFGWRWNPFGWGREWHSGLDIAADYGAPILATAAGTVVFSGWKPGGFGYTVIIDHGYGFRTLYSHNDENLVDAGDHVNRGDKVAHVGGTGLSTGPHLHYEISLWGEPIDPTPFAGLGELREAENPR